MRKIIIIYLILLTGCSGWPPPQRRPEQAKQPPPPPVAPLNKEKAIGRQFIQAALKEYTFVKDYEVVEQVNRVGNDILEAIGENPKDFHFFVVQQNQLNAFAVPGGYIFIFSGLLEQLKSEDALAGVIAHEIAHVQKKHFFKDAKKMNAINLATMASIILAGLTGKNPGATSTIAAAANISLQLKFSRKNEEEADLFAVRYLKQTRYDPSGLSEFFKTLSFYAGFTRGIEPPYFSTHPGLGERRLMVETLIKDLPVEKNRPHLPSQNWNRDWGRIMTILKAKSATSVKAPLSQPEEGEPLVSADRRFYLKGLSRFRSGRLQEAARDYQEAIQLNSKQAVYYADLSYIWMQLQEADLAEATALKSIHLSENNPIPYLVLGMIAQSKEDHKMAIIHLESASNRASDDPFIHLQLARSYHSLSKLALERFHLGRYHRLNLEPSKAIAQFQNALTLIIEEGPLVRRIKQEIEEITRDGI